MSDKGWEYSESTQTLIGTKKRRLIDEETGNVSMPSKFLKEL